MFEGTILPVIKSCYIIFATFSMSITIAEIIVGSKLTTLTKIVISSYWENSRLMGKILIILLGILEAPITIISVILGWICKIIKVLIVLAFDRNKKWIKFMDYMLERTS